MTSFVFVLRSMTEVNFCTGEVPELSRVRPHSKFTQADDHRLRMLVDEFGVTDWGVISAQMGDRNQRQCRERWINYLAPSLNMAPWTPAEDLLLLQKQREFGCKWVRIAHFFPNRTDAMVKNRFNRLRRNDSKEQELRKLCDPILLQLLKLHATRAPKRRHSKRQAQAVHELPLQEIPVHSSVVEEWPETAGLDFGDLFFEF
jgi:hypothetical protein